MKLVLDISVGIKAILPEDGSAKALKIRDDFRKGIYDLIAPDIYIPEGGNVLVLAIQNGTIPQSELYVVFTDFLRNAPMLYQSTSLFARAYTIAHQTRTAVYDALDLALSEQEGCPLLTADQKLMSKAPGFSYLTLDDL